MTNSQWINVGASDRNGRIKTKAALKRAVADNPSEVRFDQTGFMGSGPATITLETIPAGAALSVVGPDPFTKRVWYATVVVKAGKVKVT